MCNTTSRYKLQHAPRDDRGQKLKQQNIQYTMYGRIGIALITAT